MVCSLRSWAVDQWSSLEKTLSIMVYSLDKSWKQLEIWECHLFSLAIHKIIGEDSDGLLPKGFFNFCCLCVRMAV
ncbi:hypothetical protein B296_00016162 [Ensete ventricosum]|uniref:Uncharacterized protein n=1 Tax=Ensete ventricosum TaxID=4639 RepID=A0A426Y7Q7_ENSVE|nr:hypothetical protein B296_00016162 [Ensete ventricosum]